MDRNRAPRLLRPAISGAIPLLLLYAFIAWSRKILVAFFFFLQVTGLVGRAMAQAVSRRLSPRRPGFDPGQSMWDLWWTKWHWDRFFPEYFGVPLPISFNYCSITWKNKKN
jgi:hypothetical protein